MRSFSLSKRVFFWLALAAASVTVIRPQGIPDAVIEDAALDTAPFESAPVKTAKDAAKDATKDATKNATGVAEKTTTEEEDDSKKGKTEYRLYSIGNFSYQPITDPTHLAVANGLFQEKSAAAEMNLELTLHRPVQDKAGLVFKTDLQGRVSSQYGADSYFFKKGAGDWVKVNELFFEATNSIGLSLLMGKYRRIFSPGMFQNPMDRHNPKSALPGEPAQREGAWLAQLSLDGEFHNDLLSRWRVSAAWLPGFFQDKNGLVVNTRDRLVFNPSSPLGVVKTTEAYSSDYQGGLVRLYLDIFKGDFNAVYYYTEKQPQWGFSYSRYFLDRLEGHGEVLFYQRPHSGFLLGEPGQTTYADALAGFRIDIGEYTTFTMEYLYRQENPANYPDALPDQKRLWLGQLDVSSNNQATTPMRNYLVMSLLAVNLKDVFDVAFNVITNPFDNEYLFSLRTDYKPDRSAKISLAGLYKMGGANSFYGNYFPFDYQARVEFYIALM